MLKVAPRHRCCCCFFTLSLCDTFDWDLVDSKESCSWAPSGKSNARRSLGDRRLGWPKLGIEVAQAAAAARVGQLLSTSYTSVMAGVLARPSERGGTPGHQEHQSETRPLTKVPLEWKCQAGHHSSSRLNNLRSKGSWCPTCAWKSRTLGISVAHSVAMARGGHTMSDGYQNLSAKLLWKCQHGRQWTAPLGQVKNLGIWCRMCANKARRSGLDVAQQVGYSHHGGSVCQRSTLRVRVGHL